MSEPRPTAADLRLGRYRVEAVVEQRGLFVTYRATHELGHAAHLVTTAPHVVPRPELREALEAEARASANLPREAVFGLLELVEEGEGTAIAYEAPDGPSLQEVLVSTRRRGGLSPTEALALLLAAARSLALLHDRGLAHGALCPERCHLSARGALVRLRGLRPAALAPARRASSPDLTADELDDTSKEHARYRAPEQILGGEPTMSSDVFVLGLVGYELLSGRHPFEGASGAELAQKLRHAEAPPVVVREAKARFARSIAEDLERQVGAMLAKAEALRPPSAVEVARELEALARDLATDAVLGALLERLELGPSRRSAGPVTPAPGRASRALLPKLLVLALAMALGTAWLGAPREASRGRPGAASTERGAIRVLARPWAEVHLDGRRVDTTPIGHPIEVDPGPHELSFRHPSAPEERRIVEVLSGQTITVDVTMSIVRTIDAGVDPSP